TPLTSIRLFAEMLKEGRQPDIARQKKYLGLMVSETERLSRLINNVLDFSKMGQKKKQYSMEPLEITGFCAGIMENQRLGLEEKGFTLRFSCLSGDEMVEADSASLKQAFLNLISNAEKYSPDRKEITMNLIKGDGMVQIELCDRGIGIPVKDAGKIFKEFYRVDDSLTARVRGSGLGLAIVKKIMSAHSGSIHYKPRDGGGSIFVITLPVLQDGRIKR
ncbi:MAG: HAMP domain-containing histidine kinase, partial [Spirochaetales bacterium]|nr:HAMP domain-containing histidine kinase [Spirochaetales bacterium]